VNQAAGQDIVGCARVGPGKNLTDSPSREALGTILAVSLMAGGLLLAPLTTRPWHLYLTIGVMVGAGSICLGYSGQSLFPANWFNRRRGLATGFAGVGIGSATMLPWVQHMIEKGAGAAPAGPWAS
jgi:hypothetical protein